MREVILLYQIDRNPVAKSDTSSLAGLFVPLTLLCPCLPTVQPVHPCAGVRRHAAHPCATRVCYARPIRRCLASACDLALAVQNWGMSRWLNSRRSAASSDCLLSATDTSSPTSQFPLTPRKLGLTRTASLRGDFGRLVARAARFHGYSKAS